MKVLHGSIIGLIISYALIIASAQGQISEKDLNNSLHSTVLIYGSVQTKINDQDTTLYWGGSGTVLSPSGWILTNYHVAFYQDPADSEWYFADNIQICYNHAPDQSPIFLYYAEAKDYLKYVPLQSDYALLKCTRDNTGLPLAEDANLFPYYIHVGDSDKDIQVGHDIYTIGYPDYAFGSVNCSRGMVTNIISSEDLPRIRMLIGTDAEISAGNSGGAAVNREGKLVGAPTFAYHGLAGYKGYILPVNRVREMIGAWVPETELGAPVSGRIIDAETGRGVIGAAFFVLLPGIECSEVTNENWKEKTYIWIKSGLDGRFRIPFMLPIENKYSAVILAAGYQQKNLEGFYDIRNSKPRDNKIEIVRLR
ncbi:MAG: trypsin-like peptidase domain-containing protein [candidate division WOR-3 bacterium]|nr:MAG: trypsin-like peptidase domain-containing protein [candidate division WOR-3 bacterium]